MTDSPILKVNLLEIKSLAFKLKAGDMLLLNGMMYTARDQAHARLCELIRQGEPLPLELSGAVIYYAGAAAAPPHLPIGSIGPTTSSRMDAFTPTLLEHGVAATIGKGPRSPRVLESIKLHNAPYLCALGGAGALYADCVRSARVVAFPDLGCEAIRELIVENFPVVVGAEII